MELKKLKNIVVEILRENKETRGDDDILYKYVLIKINVLSGNKNLIVKIQVGTFFDIRKRYGFPSYESVSRCRRKAQEEFPDLRPPKKIQEARRMQEEMFYDFSKLKQAEFDF